MSQISPECDEATVSVQEDPRWYEFDALPVCHWVHIKNTPLRRHTVTGQCRRISLDCPKPTEHEFVLSKSCHAPQVVCIASSLDNSVCDDRVHVCFRRSYSSHAEHQRWRKRRELFFVE